MSTPSRSLSVFLSPSALSLSDAADWLWAGGASWQLNAAPQDEGQGQGQDGEGERERGPIRSVVDVVEGSIGIEGIGSAEQN